MMTNRNKTVIYTGVTDNLKRRIWEHKDKSGSSFTKRYNLSMLVDYESFSRMYDAIAQRKRSNPAQGPKRLS
jgi:putative endonuclease